MMALIATVSSFDTWDGGPTFKISKVDTATLKYEVIVPMGMYLTIALGENVEEKYKVDMIHFKGSKDEGNYKDYYGYVYEVPETASTTTDGTQNFIDMQISYQEEVDAKF